MNRKLYQYIVLILLVVSLSYSVYAYTQLNTLKQNPQKIAQEQNKELIAKVARITVLPAGEDPTVATINNPETLKAQPFFANAKAGYKVLIYQAAKQAFMYDPVADKIVNIAPVNIGEGQPKAK